MTVETPREFGEEFRRERELRDVTREQLALVTKVSVRQIEALETGRFEHLPALVFSRGFVRSIADHLGLDADRSVAAFRSVYESWQEECRKAENAPLSPTTAGFRLSKPRRAVSASTTVRGLAVALTLAVVTGAAALMKSKSAEPRRASASASVPARPETGPASLARELVAKGATREFAGGKTFTLTLGNAGVVEVVLNGRSLQPIGGPGQVVKNWVIEPEPVHTSG
jgi:cytoskeleton protein RodZ